MLFVEIFYDQFFEQVFLGRALHFHGFQQPPMRPAVFVSAHKFVMPPATEQSTYGNVHQFLFFFFAEGLLQTPQFLQADEKEYVDLIERLYSETETLLESFGEAIDKVQQILAKRESITKQEVKEILDAVL